MFSVSKRFWKLYLNKKKNVLLDSVDILSSTQLTKIQLYKVDGSLYIGTYTYKIYIFIIKNVLFVLEVIIEH